MDLLLLLGRGKGALRVGLAALFVTSTGLAACGDDAEEPTADVDTEGPGDDTETPDADTEGPGDDTETPDTDTEEPGDDTETPDADTEEPGDDTSLKAVLDATGGPVCYAIADEKAVDCGGEEGDWDFRIELDNISRSFAFWTNGAASGGGLGGALGPFSEEEIAAVDATDLDQDFDVDTAQGALITNTPFAYFDGELKANGRVYLINNGEEQVRVLFAPMPTENEIELLVVAHEDAETAELKRLVVPFEEGQAVYVDLSAVERVELTTEGAAESADWDLAIVDGAFFLNGGISGPGAVKGAVAEAQADAYDENGDPIEEAFFDADYDLNDIETLLRAEYTVNARQLIVDQYAPAISGWWGFVMGENGMPESFNAKPESWWLLRDAAGENAYKLHVLELEALYNPDHSIDFQSVTVEILKD